jgi:arylsulfatase A-like enzyme
MILLIRLFLCFAAASAAVAEDPKPNIILVLVDDLGINDLHCYGRSDHHTQNLDRLAEQGMRFTASYCAQPICSPSRAAIMTGKHPARLHITNFLPGRGDAPSQRVLQPVIEGQLPLEEITIAEVLRDAGYKTACIGKWHLGGPGFGPKEQGFDVAFAGRANTQPSATEGGKGEYELTAQAEKFIEENRERPFFLYVPHNTPHIPFKAKPELIEKNKAAWHPEYAGVIESMDDCVGRLMAKVDGLGLKERTIFIYASDNGGLHVLEFPGTPATHNTPWRAGKGYLYEGGIRDPLIIRWPGKVRPGSLCDTPVVFTDLVPTLMEAAGVSPAKTTGPLDGVSLVPLLTGGQFAERTLFWHYPNYSNQGGRPASAVREGKWKLIEQLEDGSLELYELDEDPGETSNLAAREPERAAQLKKKLDEWRRSIGAQECRPNPDFDAALHRRLYVDTDPSKFSGAKNALEAEAQEAEWRKGMNDAVKDGAGAKRSKPRVTPAKSDLRLFAKDARVHGEKLRCEPQSYKNTLGFWTNPADWADWEFSVPEAGRYEVEVTQGCGKGSGGAEVRVEIGGQALKFTVQDTGHFQNFIQRTIGEVDLAAGKQTLAVKPQSKTGAAVMDLRRVVLRPVNPPKTAGR